MSDPFLRREQKSIARLTRVPLREVWQHEQYDFSKWLKDNLEILNEALDLQLVSAEVERSAGSFSIDVVATTANGDTVVIENQLERSDHDHLGKVMTYLVALEARIAVWIVSEPRPEHVAVVAWLNDSSSANVFLVKVEAVRIGDSPPAPLLTRIVGPSEDAGSVAMRKMEAKEQTSQRDQWWEGVVNSPLSTRYRGMSYRGYTYLTSGIGYTGLGINVVLRKQDCQAELYIDTKDKERNKLIFDMLVENKDGVESAFGAPLDWQRLEEGQASRIRYMIEGGYLSEPSTWQQTQSQLVQAADRIAQAFRPYVEAMKGKV